MVKYKHCISIFSLQFENFFFPFLAFNLDNEQPDYDMDSEDETLLNRLNRKMEIKPLQFEIMIDRLEKASSNQVLYIVKMSFVLQLIQLVALFYMFFRLIYIAFYCLLYFFS